MPELQHFRVSADIFMPFPASVGRTPVDGAGQRGHYTNYLLKIHRFPKTISRVTATQP
jgi:hypothetical protein